MNIEQLASEVLQLNSQDRATLAEAIWNSLEDPYISSSDISDQEATLLAKQRNEEIDKGDALPLSHQELMSRLRENES